jgi:epoxyqueuosine reductase
VLEAVQRAAQTSEHLRFAPRAFETAEDSPFRRPGLVLDTLRRLDRLADWLRDRGAAVAHPYIDDGPIPERELAQRAGLGWIGKNTMLLHPQIGSWFFIGVLLTTAELAHDQPLADRCGTCRACLDACPTGAFVAPYVLDARRCVSYLTIEHRGEIDPDAHAGMAGWQFGCDICQDVCPWNRKAPLTREAVFAPPVPFPGAAALSAMDDESLRRRFEGTPLLRAKPSGLRRNASIYLENKS